MWGRGGEGCCFFGALFGYPVFRVEEFQPADPTQPMVIEDIVFRTYISLSELKRQCIELGIFYPGIREKRRWALAQQES